MLMADAEERPKRSWVELAFYVFIAVAVIWVFVRALRKSQNLILWNPEFGLKLLERSVSKLSESLVT